MTKYGIFALRGALLSAEHSHEHGFLSSWLSHLGRAGEFLDEVLLHGILDTLKLIPFLFLTYLLMEYIEHKASDKAQNMLRRAGPFGPLLGGALGAVPQCGFSAVAANLYTGRVLGVGTLVAVFLSTSDEMIPILLGGSVPPLRVLFVVLYKLAVGVAVGFGVDLAVRISGRSRPPIDIDSICEEDNCHCERGILHSALHHTVTVSLFVLLVTVGINCVMFFVDGEALGSVLGAVPFLSYLLCALVGLIPNCAASVLLTGLCTSGVISTGAMIAGLLSGSGVGILVLFRMNKNIRNNLTVICILLLSGIVFGALADILPFLAIR